MAKSALQYGSEVCSTTGTLIRTGRDWKRLEN